MENSRQGFTIEARLHYGEINASRNVVGGGVFRSLTRQYFIMRVNSNLGG